MSRFQTDALVPTAISNGILGRRRPAPSSNTFLNPDANAAGEQGSANDPKAARAKFAEEWNVRIDREVRAVAGGLKELVELADIGTTPAPHTSGPNALHLKIRTAQLIRATQSIRDMAHELRLMLLLSDEVGSVVKRDTEAAILAEEIKESRIAVGKQVRGLMQGTLPGDDGGVDQREVAGTSAEEGVDPVVLPTSHDDPKSSVPKTEIGQPAESPTTERNSETKDDDGMDEDSDDFEEV